VRREDNPWSDNKLQNIVGNVVKNTMAARSKLNQAVEQYYPIQDINDSPLPPRLNDPGYAEEDLKQNEQILKKDWDGINVSASIENPDINPKPIELPGQKKTMYASHKVQQGDTLSKIAKKYNTTVEDLVALNSISNPSNIQAGQLLDVPGIVQSGSSYLSSKSGPVTTGITRDFIDTVKQWEGFKNKAYWDNGQWSIGHGTKASSPSQTVDPVLAEKHLVNELSKSRERVESAANKVGAQFTKNQLDALTSFDFNTGDGVELITSSKGDVNDIMRRLPTWNRVKGKVNKGLVNRRANELNLFVSN